MSELAIINICSIEYANEINDLAELLGKGPNNLSCLLQDANGKQYLACHSEAWTVKDFLDFQDASKMAVQGADLSQYQAALQNLIWSVVDLTKIQNYNALIDHWLPTLQAYQLYDVESPHSV